ncbi:unnamed protein product [Haemonchus placei]|uniref:Phosphatase n=1 Tax=Haemonchus placei TaxID=6290 RepID=A0A0N4X3D3_HAEPC|nr:unnamed protein product [Haemonchus placei]
MTVANEVKLVIFDKDGTLVDFHRMWLPWAANTVQLLERATGRPVGAAVYKTLGVDPIQGKLDRACMFLDDASIGNSETKCPPLASWTAPIRFSAVVL